MEWLIFHHEELSTHHKTQILDSTPRGHISGFKKTTCTSTFGRWSVCDKIHGEIKISLVKCTRKISLNFVWNQWFLSWHIPSSEPHKLACHQVSMVAHMCNREHSIKLPFRCPAILVVLACKSYFDHLLKLFSVYPVIVVIRYLCSS